MTRIFSKQAKRIYLILAALFLLLFIFRLGYGYTLAVSETDEDYVSFDSFSTDNKRNYASDDYKSDKLDVGYTQESNIQPSQKYEKIAEVQTTTTEFDKNELQIRKEVENYFGIIQYERKYGNDGNRRLQLQIGVPPENFDSLYAELTQIGKTVSKEIIKNDKTNDYLELNARKASLEKTLTSLVQFKEKSGQIDEYINLENRILEIQEELQQLGVNLGDFDKSNAFCTVQFSLAEIRKSTPVTISIYHRIKVALEWTFKMYLGLIFILVLALIGTYLFVLILEKKEAILNLFKKVKKD